MEEKTNITNDNNAPLKLQTYLNMQLSEIFNTHQYTVNKIDKINELINLGADINFQDSKGETILFKAFNHLNAYGIKKLVKLGANVNVQNKNGWTPLHSAVSHPSRVELTMYLIKHGANIYSKTNDNRTVLDIAKYRSRYENEELINYLERYIKPKDYGEYF